MSFKSKTVKKPPRAAPSVLTLPGVHPRAVIPIKPLTSWSFSRYSDWRNCPLKCKLKHVDKLKEPGSPAMERGNRVHKDAEAFIKGEATALAPELSLFKAVFAELKKLYKRKSLPMIVEDNWAFTASWEVTQWNDWVGCWVRIKLDCAHYTAPGYLVVTDWKTGKPNDFKTNEYMEQLELYALSALLMQPDLETVQVRLGWTDTGQMYPEVPLTYTQADLPRLQKEWNARVKPMMTDTTFVPKPNNLCRYCWFGQSKVAEGGPGLCRY